MFSYKVTRLQFRLLLFVALIILLIFSRAFWIEGLNFNSDEARTALRAQGTVLQTILWQPQDWPPLHNILVEIWGRYFSAHPVMLRFFSFLIILPAIALVFQVARRFFRDDYAAYLAMIAFTAFGYSSYLASLLRGYGLALVFFLFLFYLTLAYFEQGKRSPFMVYMAVAIALVFYTTYTSLFALAMLGLYTLMRYRWQVWRWLYPAGLAFILIVPQFARLVSTLFEQTENAETLAPNQIPPLLDSTLKIYQLFTGTGWYVWFALIAIAIVSLVWHWNKERVGQSQVLWLLIAIISAPLLVYSAYALSIFFVLDLRYIWWAIIPLALIIGGGIAYLPRPVMAVVGGIMLILLFFPMSYNVEREGIPIEHTLETIAKEAQAGDVMLVDPVICNEVGCDFFHTWTYYYSYFLEDSVPIVEEAGDHRQIWYIYRSEWQDMTIEASVNFWRLSDEPFGDDLLSAQRYTAPPDPEGILFENGIRFHGIDFVNEQSDLIQAPVELREHDSARVRLWWSLDEKLENEYSVSVQLMDSAGNLLAQGDEAPQLIHMNPENPYLLPQSMTEWETGQLYLSERRIQLPALDDPIDLDIFLVVYQWWDGVRLESDENNEAGQLPIGQVRILGW